MNLFDKLRQLRLGGVVGAVLAVLFGLLFEHFQIGQGLKNRSYDFLIALRPYIATDEMRMIYMDDESYANLKQPENAPWNRALHAKLLDYLKADHAKAVTFDIVFSDPGRDPAADQSFADAIESNGKVVLAADCVITAVGRSVYGRSYVPPYDMFSKTNSAIGSAEIPADDDLVVRKHLRVDPDEQILGISWVTANMAGAAVTKKEKASDRDRWINYYGPPLTIPSVSYFRVLDPQTLDDAVPRGYFSNKVVFVGSRVSTKFGGDRKDEYSTPYSFWLANNRFIPGVEIQATACLNLIRGDWISTVPYQEWLVIILGLIIGFGLAQYRPLPAVGMAAVISVIVLAISYFLFSRQHLLVFWLVIVGVQIPIALLSSVVYNSVQLYVQNRLFEESLRMYLSPKLVKKFSSEKDILKPGAKKQLLTALFSDIAGFTSISEGMDSDDLAALMNRYFESAVSDCIHKTDGTIVKYIGDAIFAFWNAPDSQVDHAMRACEAALRFRDQPKQYIKEHPLITRIGLHTGVSNVGNFGSTARVDYTAIGENINLAARMEGLNKYLGTEVLITADTQSGISGRLHTRFLGDFQLKGFEKTVAVYELVGQVSVAEAHKTLDDAFAKALELFVKKDFVAAEMAFHRVLEINPKDGPSKFYLKFIAEIRDHPLPDDWKGEIELKEK
ncbi:MAG TPA: adenylate/guanylate cyclase domain-containing protein [Verrucomicrobiae bacterium]|nr:adenylate/guanylate cyclase domain-containing protein [Verrucomicrobiae bacterium]